MKYLILFSALAGSVLLYLLSSVSAETNLSSRNYFSLLLLTGALALILLALVGYQFWQLRQKLKQKVYGARLTLRLALFFMLIGVLPGLLMYAVSVQFLGKSIESWFDVRVEKALEGGLNLARNTLQNELDTLTRKGQFVALILAEQAPEQHSATLARFVAEGSAQEAAVYGNDGKRWGHAGSNRNWQLGTPTSAILREAWQRGNYSTVDALPDERLILRVLIPIRGTWPDGERRTLQFIQPVPEKLAADADTVQAVYGDYQQLVLSRLGLKRLYAITLTLSLLIVVLSAVSAAFFISARLSAPLNTLAAGTQAVARGDFSQQHPVQSHDELGGLTALFNQMTAQLAAAKTFSEQQQRRLEQARAYLESVLAHLSSGVLVVDSERHLRAFNSSASRILGVALDAAQGEPLSALAQAHPSLRIFLEGVAHEIDTAQEATWQRQIERPSRNGNQVLLLRGTRLGGEIESSHVVVFDDITHLLQAEREAAWGEVARRLAHEIKNPLTPIQLSAERLHHKLADKLEPAEAQLLERATRTIVSQVAAMKNMVSDFADYARAPAPKLVALDMHQLIHEVMGLYEANSSPITLQLEAQHTYVRGDATRLRQVVHNLLQNAHDALQQTAVRQIRLATANPSATTFELVVADNGSGFSEAMLKRAFEPYVTTKARGTGLGLPIVKKIVEEHGGAIHIENLPQGGACVRVTLPLWATENGETE